MTGQPISSPLGRPRHKGGCGCRRCQHAARLRSMVENGTIHVQPRQSSVEEEVIDLARASGLNPEGWQEEILRRVYADYGTFQTRDQAWASDQARRFYGNRWTTDPGEQPPTYATGGPIRGGLIRAGRTSDPDGNVVHIITTI